MRFLYDLGRAHTLATSQPMTAHGLDTARDRVAGDDDPVKVASDYNGQLVEPTRPPRVHVAVLRDRLGALLADVFPDESAREAAWKDLTDG
jgi:hypothetical protein